MAQLKGIYPILATPFQADGSLDETSFEGLVEFLVASEVQGATLFGLAGEYYKLSDDERYTLQRIFLARTQGHLTRIVSISDHSLEVARRRAVEAANAGTDALLIMPPFFLFPELSAVREHVAEIARAVQIPILVHYAPNQTGLRLPAKFFVALAEEFPHLRCVKVDSTPAGPMISSLVEESGGRIQPFVGYAGLQMIDAFSHGAVGCMPGCSMPEPYLEIYRALAQNDLKAAATQHARVLPLINFMMQSLEFIIQCEKSILFWRGVISSDYCRRPSMRLTANDLRSLRELFESTVPHIAKNCVRAQ
jgi:4-hydroxy-tetrahydrodipicolinate synthase